MTTRAEESEPEFFMIEYRYKAGPYSKEGIEEKRRTFRRLGVQDLQVRPATKEEAKAVGPVVTRA